MVLLSFSKFLHLFSVVVVTFSDSMEKIHWWWPHIWFSALEKQFKSTWTETPQQQHSFRGQAQSGTLVASILCSAYTV